MPRLIWSPAASADVRRLHRFLAEKNPEAARRAALTIRSGIHVLARHPELGRPAERMEAGFREHLIPFGHGGYVALYRLDGETVVILAVRHGREAGC